MTAWPKTPVPGATLTHPKFEWDGWTMVKETTGSVVTRYIAPQGQIHSFERGGQVYQVHSDAHNGSVRAITDASGAVVAHSEYGAWGELLGSSSAFSGGFSYGYVGSLGVRTDESIGLLYMRHRWYDPNGLQRFLSRDSLRSTNAHVYAHNNPVNWIDRQGLWAEVLGNPTKQQIDLFKQLVKECSGQKAEICDGRLTVTGSDPFNPIAVYLSEMTTSSESTVKFSFLGSAAIQFGAARGMSHPSVSTGDVNTHRLDIRDFFAVLNARPKGEPRNWRFGHIAACAAFLHEIFEAWKMANGIPFQYQSDPTDGAHPQAHNLESIFAQLWGASGAFHSGDTDTADYGLFHIDFDLTNQQPVKATIVRNKTP